LVLIKDPFKQLAITYFKAFLFIYNDLTLLQFHIQHNATQLI